MREAEQPAAGGGGGGWTSNEEGVQLGEGDCFTGDMIILCLRVFKDGEVAASAASLRLASSRRRFEERWRNGTLRRLSPVRPSSERLRVVVIVIVINVAVEIGVVSPAREGNVEAERTAKERERAR